MKNRGISWFIRIDIGIGLLLMGLIAFDRWRYPVYGSNAFLINFFLFFLLLGLTGLVALIGGLLATFAKKYQTFQLGLALTVPLFTVLGLGMWSAISDSWIREPLFERQLSLWLETEEPMVGAIQAFEATNQTPPASIQDLFPTYLAPPDWPNENHRAIPAAALGLGEDTVRVEYEYCPLNENGQDTWVLYLRMGAPRDWSDFMHLMYRPNQQYSPAVPVIGGWALIERDTAAYLNYCD